MDKVTVCNLALAAVGVSQYIANIDTERSNEANNCRLMYDNALGFVLRDYDWNFARVRMTLALAAGNVASTWTYKYVYPPNCFMLRAIVPPGIRYPRKDQRVPYEVGFDGTAKVIYTDQANAEAMFTALVDNPALFDPQFVEAFSFYLGMKVAVPLSLKADVVKQAQAGYVLTMARAVSNDLRERETGPEPDSEMLTFRNSGSSSL